MPPLKKSKLERKIANASVNPDEVYKYLTIDKGVSHEHAMGMLSNIVEESKFQHGIKEGASQLDNDKKGLGLFQYTYPSRRKSFVDTVPDWQNNWKGQIDFALTEDETKNYLAQDFDNPNLASQYFTKKWERPANANRQAKKRLEYMPGLLDIIGEGSGKSYYSDKYNSVMLPQMNVIENDPIRDVVDPDVESNIMNDLAYTESLNNTNYFAQGGVHGMNNMNKRYYAKGGVNPSLVKSLIKNEGFIGVAYPDVTGKTTIGYGYTKDALTGKNGIPSWKEYWKADGTPIKRMSEDEANEIREAIVQERVDTVNNNVNSEIIESLSQEQYNSLVDLVYRNGSGNLRDSGLWDVINKGKGENFQEIAEFIVTSPNLLKAGGKVLEEGDDGYNGIAARNKRAASTFDKNQGSVNPVTDNMARANGDPTSQDINNELFGGFESAEEQQVATENWWNNYYANAEPTTNTNNENMATQDPKEPEYLDKKSKLYGETVDGIESMLNNLFMNDDYQVDGEDAISMWDNGTKERMAWLAKKVPTIAAAMKPDGGRGARFAIDRTLVKDNIHKVLNELNQITDGDDERPYGDRIYTNPNEPGDIGNDTDFPDSNQFENNISIDNFADARKYSMLEEDAIARDAEIEAERAASAADYTPEEIEANNRDRGVGEFIYENIRPYEDPSQIMIDERGVPVTEESDVADFNSPNNLDFTIDDRSVPVTEEEDVADFEEPAQSRNPNLNRPDYNNLISSLGSYAARMAPLAQALRDANSYDRVRYPSISPTLPTAHAQRNEVNTAFTTAQNTARLQGKLDLGALSALATQQAKSVAGVEENVANQRIGIINQAEQYNNENAIRGMIDEAGNKGAAGTMKYQALAAMSQMGQGSLREYNMQRNDANVKKMFEDVFDEKFSQYKS